MKKSVVKEQTNQQIQSSRKIISSYKAKADRNRTLSEFVGDFAVSKIGSVEFLTVNILIYLVWIYINLGYIPLIKPFDPFPFGLLTMIVSFEAIILAIFVLISQNRAAKIADIREEVDLQVDVTTEQEVTKALELLILLLKKNKIDISKDIILKELLQPPSHEKIEKALEKEMIHK